MKQKRLFAAALAAWVSLQAHAHDAYQKLGAAPVFFGFYKFTSYAVPYTRPVIESILYNPAVHKQYLPGNAVRATGNHAAVAAHFIIHFRKEQLHGNWQSFYANNQACDSGRLYRNLPDGEWKTWYRSGRLKTVRTYNAQKYLYIKADLLRNHPRDQRYAITRFDGTGATKHLRPRFDGALHNSVALSMLEKIRYNTSGKEGYLPPFAACAHHGAFINYSEEGVVTDSGYYANGLPDGMWKETAPGGTIQAVGFYRHGIRQGTWKYYNSKGQPIYTEHYNRNGKRRSTFYFRK